MGHFPASLLKSRVSRARRDDCQSWLAGPGAPREACRSADQDDFGEVTVEVDAISAVQGVDPDALLQAGIGEVGGIVEKLSVRVLEESA